MLQRRAIQAVHGCDWAQVRLEEGITFFLKSCNLSLSSWLENQHQAAPCWPLGSLLPGARSSRAA